MKTRKKTKSVVNEAALLPCMAYLHGNIVDGEFEAACTYEYARESKVLRWAARLWRRNATDHEIYSRVDQKFDCGVWFIQHPWSSIWSCQSFPEKSWNQLSDEERTKILWVFSRSGIQPLSMDNVMRLDSIGILSALNSMVEETRRTRRENPDGSKSTPYPIIENNEWVFALFTMNFSKSKKRLRQEFEKWLELPENKQRLNDHKQNSVGKTGGFKDRLKDIAAARLYNALGCDEALKFAENNRIRDKLGRARRFHDARQGQADKLPLNQAALYSEESGFVKANAEVRDYLKKLMPWEFSEQGKTLYPPEVRQMAEAFRREISKSSS